jgi:hypothetical protein
MVTLAATTITYLFFSALFCSEPDSDMMMVALNGLRLRLRIVCVARDMMKYFEQVQSITSTAV